MAGNNGSGKKRPWYEVKGDDDSESSIAKVINKPKKEINDWSLMRKQEFWVESRRLKALETAAAAADRRSTGNLPPNETEDNQEEEERERERSEEEGNSPEEPEGLQQTQVEGSGNLEAQLLTLTTYVGVLANNVERLNAYIGINGISNGAHAYDYDQGQQQITDNQSAPPTTAPTPSSSSTLFNCNQCPMTFGTPSARYIHHQKVHRNKVWECQYCGRQFSLPTSKSRHLLRDHAEEHQKAKEAKRRNRGAKKTGKCSKKTTGKKGKKNVKAVRTTGGGPVYV